MRGGDCRIGRLATEQQLRDLLRWHCPLYLSLPMPHFPPRTNNLLSLLRADLGGAMNTQMATGPNSALAAEVNCTAPEAAGAVVEVGQGSRGILFAGCCGGRVPLFGWCATTRRDCVPVSWQELRPVRAEWPPDCAATCTSRECVRAFVAFQTAIQ